MAAPIAYEEPTINRAWQAFVAHLPTIALLWLSVLILMALGIVASLLVFLVLLSMTGGDFTSVEQTAFLASGMGNLVQLPFLIVGNMLAVLLMAVPAMHYETGETIGLQQAFGSLLRRPWRYFLAGLLFSLVCGVGLLMCVLPGVAVALTVPIYVNRIFNGDENIIDAFFGSFQAVYGSERGFTFIGIQVLAFLCVTVASLCTCFLGGFVAIPVATFYIQNSAYRQGVLR